MKGLAPVGRTDAAPLIGAGLVVGALLCWRIGLHPELPAFLYLAAIGVVLVVVDLRSLRLPDKIVLPSYGIGLVLLAATGATTPLVRAVLAAALSFLLYLILAIVNPRGLGFGDVKLAGLLGLYLGWLGWNAVFIGMLAAFVLAAISGVVLITAGRADRKTLIPFGPFMLAGALLAVLV